MDASFEFFTKKLAQNGLRFSLQRMKVLEYLYQHKGCHPDAEEIFKNLSTEIPGLSKTTIYNTLHTFVDVGLARTIDIENIEIRYDPVIKNHGHFICKKCGSVYDFKIDVNTFPVEELDQFEIMQKDVIFKGLCPNCLNENKKK